MESEPLTLSNIDIAPEDWALTPPVVQQILLQVVDRLVALEEEVR
jgi:hypothetical protein